MKIKKSTVKVGLILFLILFLAGLKISYDQISAQHYITQHMYNLAISKATEQVNRILGVAAISLATIFVLIVGIKVFWRRYLSKLVEIKIRINQPLLSVALRVFFILAIILGTVLLVLAYLSLAEAVTTKSFLISSLIVIFMLLISVWIATDKLKSYLGYVRKFLLSRTLSIIAGCCFFFFILSNLFVLYNRDIRRPDRPNVIIVVADALRPDHLGCYGYKQPTSPAIDKFASQALLFENVWANSPWTKPSVGSLFTSLYPHEHGAFFWTGLLSDGSLTMAEFMKNSWYKTMAVQTNPAISKYYKFNQGFDYFEEKPLASGEEVNRAFGQWLAKNKRRHFFVYLHYYDTHHPYGVPLDYAIKFGADPGQHFLPKTLNLLEIRALTKIGLSQDDKASIIKLYDGAINYFDEQFSCLLAMLKEYGIINNTIVIITSDHGEEFWEHGNYEHGHSVYDEVLRVPLIIGYGNKMPPRRVPGRFQLVDILPIIARLSNLESPPNIRGIDVAKGSKDRGRIVFAEGLLYGEEKKVVIRDNFKLISNTGKVYPGTLELYGFLDKYFAGKPKGDVELYNLERDGQELDDLSKALPEMTGKLKRILDRMTLLNSGPFHLNKENTDKKLEDLRLLGYIH